MKVKTFRIWKIWNMFYSVFSRIFWFLQVKDAFQTWDDIHCFQIPQAEALEMKLSASGSFWRPKEQQIKREKEPHAN